MILGWIIVGFLVVVAGFLFITYVRGERIRRAEEKRRSDALKRELDQRIEYNKKLTTNRSLEEIRSGFDKYFK